MRFDFFTDPRDPKLATAWRFVQQKAERAELAVAVYRAAPLAELEAARSAMNAADINLCAAWSLYYDELQDARQRETERPNAA